MAGDDFRKPGYGDHGDCDGARLLAFQGTRGKRAQGDQNLLVRIQGIDILDIRVEALEKLQKTGKILVRDFSALPQKAQNPVVGPDHVGIAQYVFSLDRPDHVFLFEKGRIRIPGKCQQKQKHTG